MLQIQQLRNRIKIFHRSPSFLCQATYAIGPRWSTLGSAMSWGLMTRGTPCFSAANIAEMDKKVQINGGLMEGRKERELIIRGIQHFSAASTARVDAHKNEWTRGVIVPSKWSFVFGRSSPADFDVDSDADFDADFGADFGQNLADFSRNAVHFTDFLTCHKLRFTNYILNILNEIPIKIGREGDTCHVRIYWTNYGRNFILEDGTHECQLTKLMLNQYLRMAVLVNEYVPISQVYAWLVLLMLGNPGIVPVPASASTSAHARKPSFQSVYNEMNIKKPIEMHSAKIQLDLVRYDVKLSW